MVVVLHVKTLFYHFLTSDNQWFSRAREGHMGTAHPQQKAVILPEWNKTCLSDFGHFHTISSAKTTKVQACLPLWKALVPGLSKYTLFLDCWFPLFWNNQDYWNPMLHCIYIYGILCLGYLLVFNYDSTGLDWEWCVFVVSIGESGQCDQGGSQAGGQHDPDGREPAYHQSGDSQ